MPKNYASDLSAEETALIGALENLMRRRCRPNRNRRQLHRREVPQPARRSISLTLDEMCRPTSEAYLLNSRLMPGEMSRFLAGGNPHAPLKIALRRKSDAARERVADGI